MSSRKRIPPGQREFASFFDLAGETIDRVEHGSLRVSLTSLSGRSTDGGRDRRMLTIKTKSGREFVIAPVAGGELELSEIGQEPKPIGLTWNPLPVKSGRSRHGTVEKKMSDGSAQPFKCDDGGCAVPLSAARKLASELGVKLEVLP